MAKELKKASFLRRIAAYVIDMVIIGFIAGLIATPFTDTKKMENINKREIEVIQKYQTGEISSKEYVSTYGDIYYDLVKTTGINTFIGIVLSISYFVILQTYLKGQTLGKKILKIKVIPEEGELTMNQMILRSLLANFILVNIINFAFLTFAPKYVYVMGTGIITMINYVLIFISVILATTKEGRTIHDRVAHTRVVREN